MFHPFQLTFRSPRLPVKKAMVKRLMEMAGANVDIASSASGAMEVIARRKPDVLLCDIGMPGEDGYSLIKKVRQLYPHLPAVALTAYARAEDRTAAIRAGFDNHLAKPVDATELLAVVARLTA